MKHLDIKIYGRVQRVFYRISARREARSLGIFGYVKNMKDGTVKIEAEGDEEKLQELLAWCRRGSIMAKVAKVDYEESGILKEYNNFEIRF